MNINFCCLDSEQTIYVWLDALVNYKTVNDGFTDFNGELVHIIGKDIAKFHCVYWPAFLAAADYKLPKEVIVHGHWKKDNLKMSKSIGNVIEPFSIIDTYGLNAVRAYLLASGPQHKDTNFEISALKRLHDGLLIDGFINMFFRCTGKKFNFEVCQLNSSLLTSEDHLLIQKVKEHTKE